MVKATVTELKYEDVRLKLNKIFSDDKELSSEFSSIQIKPEGVYYSEQDAADQQASDNEDEQSTHHDESDILYA